MVLLLVLEYGYINTDTICNKKICPAIDPMVMPFPDSLAATMTRR